MRAIDGFDGQAATKIALELLAIVATRPGELRHARWAELDFEQAVWTVPSERMKMRRAHKVPLPEHALELLLELRELTGWGDCSFRRSARRTVR